MTFIQQAVELNARGIASLTANEPNSAFACFKEALGVLNSLVDHDFALPTLAQSSSPLVAIDLSEANTEGRRGYYNRAFEFAFERDSELSAELLTLFSGVVIYNCGLSLQHVATKSSLAKACRLYDQSVQVLYTVLDCFDCMDAIICGMRHRAEILFALGDICGAQMLLDSLLLLNTALIVANGVSDKIVAAAMA